MRKFLPSEAAAVSSSVERSTETGVVSEPERERFRDTNPTFSETCTLAAESSMVESTGLGALVKSKELSDGRATEARIATHRARGQAQQQGEAGLASCAAEARW